MAEREGRAAGMHGSGALSRVDPASPVPATQGEASERPVRVLAAVIRRGDSYLLCRRPAHKRHGRLWEFPGGKLEDGESLLEAARREMREELGVGVSAVGDVRFKRRDPGSPFVIEFVDVEIDGEPEALEHEEVRWVVVGEMGALDLAPSDRAFVEEMLSGGVPRA